MKGPDGMRAANGKLIVAESGSGRISIITVNGDKASVKVIKEGLNTPIAVGPAGETIWIAERGAGKADPNAEVGDGTVVRNGSSLNSEWV